MEENATTWKTEILTVVEVAVIPLENRIQLEMAKMVTPVTLLMMSQRFLYRNSCSMLAELKKVIIYLTLGMRAG